MNGMQLYQSHDMVKGEEIILKYAQKGETAKKKNYKKHEIIKNICIQAKFTWCLQFKCPI